MDAPDGGRVILPRGCRLGYVEQELSEEALETPLLTYVLDVLHDWSDFWAQWEEAASSGDQARLGQLMQRQTELESAYGYNPEHRAKAVLSGLGFSEEKWYRKLGQLSGGWRERAKLARVLTAGADVLLLDEPTNHLDVEAVEWLESFLLDFKGALVFVAHDRVFMDTVGTHVLYLGLSRPVFRKATYSQFLELQEEYNAQREREAKALQDELNRKMAFVERFRAKATKARQAGSRQKMAKKLEKALPYRLTGAQKETLSQIRKDMEGPSLMSRLIQGDVGSGKTIVAALALTAAVESGFQGALMAPTEVLARQHYKTLTGLFAEHGLSFRVELLTGSMTAKQKREACERIASHEADIIVGTHALIQEKVVYSCLGLVITDEQHRFGVRQRENLSKKGGDPHVLVMSATPIPRTLAIILYGDLDISVMDELPAKRLPVKNCVVGTEFRENAYRFMEKEIRAGHQAYVICPMVEAGGLSEGENVVDYAGRLRGFMPSSVRVDYLHGRMSPAQKDQKMEDFASGKTHILVSTTVVEVGVDVPNATVMMIENAERFGLAQLHQLRGRVGRGKDQSYCIFVNGSGDSEKNRRLEILNSSNDGFYIASEDLKLRGPGDIFGIRQSGLLEFSIGDIFTDAKLLKAAAEDAQKVLEEDPELSHEENRNLKRQIEKSLKERAESGMSL